MQNRNKSLQRGGVLKFSGLSRSRACTIRRPRSIAKGKPVFAEFCTTLPGLFDAHVVGQVYEFLFTVVYAEPWRKLESLVLEQRVITAFTPSEAQKSRYCELVSLVMNYFELKGKILSTNEPHRCAMEHIVWQILVRKAPNLMGDASVVAAQVFESAFAFTDSRVNFDYEDLVADICQRIAALGIEPPLVREIVAGIYDYMLEKDIWG